MRLSRLLCIVAVCIGIAAANYTTVWAQKSGATLQSEVGTNFPDNTTGLITPAILRQTINDIIKSILTNAGCPTQLLGFAGDGITPQCYSALAGAVGSISVKVRSAATSSVTASAVTDYFLCLDPTSNTITMTLPGGVTLGQSFLVKDCTGQASGHNITVVPTTGTIDNASTFIMNTNFQSAAFTYTGTQWSVN